LSALLISIETEQLSNSLLKLKICKEKIIIFAPIGTVVAIPSSLEMDVEQVTQHVAARFGNYFIQKDLEISHSRIGNFILI